MRPWLLPALPALLALVPQAGQGRLKDPEAAALAQKALASTDRGEQRAALKRLEAHVFRSSKAKERELVLFAMGLLQDRLGDPRAAAESLRKLERTWPQSPFLEEAQVVLAEEALGHKKFPEAEQRLRRVLASELPVETKRRAQEMLLWALVEQDKAKEGAEVLASLHPLPPGSHPSERGLVAMFEVAAANGDRKQAEALNRDYGRTFKDGPMAPRMQLGWARQLGAHGDNRGSAQILRKLIQEHPKAPEANDARLALATLLTEGKLSPTIRKAFPTPERLLAELEGITAKGDPARRALVLKLRLAVQGSDWKQALDLARQYRTTFNGGPEQATVAELWGEAYRAWTQQILEKGPTPALLPTLTPEAMLVLRPEQRLSLVRKLAKGGLSAPLPTLIAWAPDQERTGLRTAALQELVPEAHADVVLQLLPGRGEGPAERLLRARAEVALAHWPQARAALAGAQPGPERMDGVLALLRRPTDPKEPPQARLREAEAQLSRAPEKGPEREPLVILVADHRAKAGDWRGALGLYPASPSKEQLGWVSLMRATAQWKLGQKEAARATLKAAENTEAFRPERQTLGREL